MNNFVHNGYFSSAKLDKEVSNILDQELNRQKTHIELIASENYVSKAVLNALGSIFNNKSVEGYPFKRYYSGVEFSDNLENLAIDRAKKLFRCQYANVQPHSGSQANHAAYMALLQPGDKILSMELSSGGHLSHGAKPNFSSRVYKFYNYGLNSTTDLIDYENLEKIAKEKLPKLIIAGGSSYSRIIDFERIGKVAKEIGAFFLVDMAHFSGLVATGLYPDPFEYADVVTTTTYKSLRGPRGAMILSNNLDLGKKIDSAVFPGFQGTPLLTAIAAKAICFSECLRPEFKIYNKAVLENAFLLSKILRENGLDIISEGTDTGLMVVDLRSTNLKGNEGAELLDQVGLTCNKNSIPNDPEKPTITSGIRISTNAGTTRGLGKEEFKIIGDIIVDMLKASNDKNNIESKIKLNRTKVSQLCSNFPIY